MEVGACDDGFCDPLAIDIARTGRSMGDSGPAYQVGKLFNGTDDLHTGGILQVVYTRDYIVTWSASLYSIGPVSQVYGSFLGEFLVSHGNIVDDEHCFSSSDGRSVRENDPYFKGHAIIMHLGF